MPTPITLYPILKTRLKWLMVFRVVLVIIFLGTSLWFQFRQTSPLQSSLYPIYAIVIITCLLTILYSVIFKWVKDIRLFAYLQIFFDILLVTATVYVTGGLESLLSFLYFLSIISASILLNRRGGFYAASASSIAYGLLVNLDFYKVLPPKYKVILMAGTGYDKGDILATLTLYIIGFFTVAFLTGYLAEQTVAVEKELEEKKIDFKKLEVLNQYIVENINSGILTIDTDARITSFNKAAERITGYSLVEVYNQSIDIIFQDLTKIKNMEEQLRRVDRLRALGGLAAGMSHEVRNPLASISGSVQVLKDSLTLDGDNQHLMEIIIRETDRLNALVTDFLLFARPAAKMTRIDLKDVITETINMFRNSPESRNIFLGAKLEYSLVINCDSRQLKQIFWNLLLNASHAMPDGGVLRIDSRLKTQDHSLGSGGLGLKSDSVEITISDTGVGQPARR